MNTQNPNNQPACHSYRLLMVFITIVCINWAYVEWIAYAGEIIANGWLTVLPFFAFLYGMFTLLSCLEIYRQTRVGISLASVVILFGVICDTVTYSFVHIEMPFLQTILIALIVMNFAFIFYLICQSAKFKSS